MTKWSPKRNSFSKEVNWTCLYRRAFCKPVSRTRAITEWVHQIYIKECYLNIYISHQYSFILPFFPKEWTFLLHRRKVKANVPFFWRSVSHFQRGWDNHVTLATNRGMKNWWSLKTTMADYGIFVCNRFIQSKCDIKLRIPARWDLPNNSTLSWVENEQYSSGM